MKKLNVYEGFSVSDGDGVKLTRFIGTPALDNIDPFVMLDEFRSDNPDDYIGGFPPHPHRGIETITYIKKGRFQHTDSTGGSGELGAGGVQWMTAGRGIIHSEMPVREENELWGFQLWLNLPRKDKMVEPVYQQLEAEEIPSFESDHIFAKIISGSFSGVESPLQNKVKTEYYDLSLAAGSETKIPIEKGCQGFIYLYDGGISVKADSEVESMGEKQLLAFEGTDELIIKSGESNSGFLFLCSRPNREPIVRGGPFVMNTKAEIVQAFDDYHSGKFE